MIVWAFVSSFADEPAVDVSRYPLKAEVALPATGVARIHVPLAMRSADDPVDGSDLLLLNAAGRPIPLARAASDAEPRRWSGMEDDDDAEVSWSPTADPSRFQVVLRGRAADALTVDLVDDGAATVTVLDAAGARVGGPALVWRISPDLQSVVPLDKPTVGSLTLLLEWQRDPVGFTVGGQADGNQIPMERWRLPLGSARTSDGLYARYDLALDVLAPVTAVTLRPSDARFDREAGLAIPMDALPTEGLLDNVPTMPMSPVRVRRGQMSGIGVEQLRIPGPGSAADRLQVLISTDPVPLDVPEVELEALGVVLLGQDVGPGPFTLYGGATSGTSPLWDLQSTAFDLERAGGAAAEPTGIGPNPAYVPPEIATGLGAPGAPIELRAMRWSRAVTGEPGFARIPLDLDVLSHARVDLADVRLVDAEGRQIPYVRSRRGGEVSWGPLQMTRKEDGSRSLLTVELARKDVPVSSLALTGPGAPFSRSVTVSRPAGGRLEPVRIVSWPGSKELTVDVGARFADRLVVEIDNGDNPPVQVDGIDVRWPQWELLAVLPAGGARLVYGNTRLTAPDYDLASLVGSVPRRARPAELGPEERLAPPPLAAGDRLLLGVALAAYAAGLGLVLVRALRAVEA